MLQLNPQKPFNFSRQLDNVSDTTTYYLQAVVRLNSTNAVLATINMTDKGSQRFVGSFTPPNDPGGSGYDISITTSVYTDSGYTSLSPVYSTVATDYRVQLLFSPAFGYGGSSGVEPKVLRKIIQEELDDLKKKKTPQPVSANQIREIVAEMLSPFFGNLESYLLYMKDGFGKNNLTIEGLSKAKEKREQDIIDGFWQVLSNFLMTAKKDSDMSSINVKNMVSEFTSSLKEFFDERETKSGKLGEVKHNELLNKIKEISTEHFNELIGQYNKDSEEKKGHLSQLIEDIFKAKKSIQPISEQKVDYLAKARKLLNY